MDNSTALDVIVPVGVGAAAVVGAPFALAAAGFTSAGIAAGSLAASAQSAGLAGSTFAALQSAGAAGLGYGGIAAVFGAGAYAGKRAADQFPCDRRSVDEQCVKN